MGLSGKCPMVGPSSRDGYRLLLGRSEFGLRVCGEWMTLSLPRLSLEQRRVYQTEKGGSGRGWAA